ncbi:unnamed protein product [Ambrosiozyma monospora]|uniref:Unnamed protein product n=1 Tax=Ambrosiozyma monospora TaxID=43982 RepID=A0ACB5TBY7_AMBMO|nr:unnamed protein product [Ambrosiozyma monospora]
MKFATLSAVSLALVSKALADETVELFIKSDNSDVSGKGISAIHEGAGINYFFAGNGAQDLSYDGSSLTSNEIGYPQWFTPDGFVQMSVSGEVTGITFDSDGTLEYNGSADGFQACKNVNDPYNYSKSQYAIMYKSSSGDCVDIKLIKKGGSSSSGSASSSVPASTSSEASSSAVVTPTPANNGTVHTTNTKTDVSTETDTISCHKCEISTYSGAADMMKPAGFAAMVAGAAALLI